MSEQQAWYLDPTYRAWPTGVATVLRGVAEALLKEATAMEASDGTIAALQVGFALDPPSYREPFVEILVPRPQDGAVTEEQKLERAERFLSSHAKDRARATLAVRVHVARLNELLALVERQS